MATKVRGNDVVLYVKDDDEFKPVACSTSCELTSSAELIEISTVSSGYHKEFDYQSFSWQVTCDGIIILDDDATKASLTLLLATQRNALTMLMQFSLTDEVGSAKTYSGYVLIPSVVISGGVDDFARMQVTMQGTGDILISDGLAPDVTVTVTLAELDGSTGSVNSVTLVDAIGTEYEILATALTSGSASQDVPAGVYKIRISITTDHSLNTWTHDATPGDSQFFGSGTATWYDDPEPVWDFTADRTITVTTGGA